MAYFSWIHSNQNSLEWLESMREKYSRLFQHFEEYLLTVDPAKRDVELSPAEQHANCYLALDDHLECAPVQTIFHLNDLSIE